MKEYYIGTTRHDKKCILFITMPKNVEDLQRKLRTLDGFTEEFKDGMKTASFLREAAIARLDDYKLVDYLTFIKEGK